MIEGAASEFVRGDAVNIPVVSEQSDLVQALGRAATEFQPDLPPATSETEIRRLGVQTDIVPSSDSVDNVADDGAPGIVAEPVRYFFYYSNINSRLKKIRFSNGITSF